MNFSEAVKSALSQYVGFSGRARRSEYWYFFLFTFLVSLVAAILDAVLDTSIIQIIVALAFVLPSLAVGVRRLHDTGRSGFWILIGLIPIIGAIVLIVFYVSDSKPDNEYGPNPKGVGGAVGGPVI